MYLEYLSKPIQAVGSDGMHLARDQFLVMNSISASDSTIFHPVHSAHIP